MQNHLKTVISWATYLSKTTQNLIINYCRPDISFELITRISVCCHCLIFFYKSNYLSNRAQVSLVLRFSDCKDQSNIREDSLLLLMT